MRILCLGDSLTQGFDVPFGMGWVELMNKKNPHIDFLNAGVCGETLSDMWKRYQQYYRSQMFDYVFFMGGTNDIYMGRNAEYCTKATTYIGSKLVEEGINLVLGIPPYTQDSDCQINQELKQYGENLQQWCEEKSIVHINFLSLFSEHSSIGFFFDDAHPNEKGYYAMYELAYSVWEKILKK